MGKMKQLLEKDKEMQDFIDGYDAKRSALVQQGKDMEARVLQLLEAISICISRESQLPSMEKFAQLKDDVEFKEKQAEYAEMTQEQLDQQLAVRRAELEKIQALDTKISEELHLLQEKTVSMNRDLSRYENPEAVVREVEGQCSKLNTVRDHLSHRRHYTKQVRDVQPLALGCE
jgi:intraflagellar transport protein 74